MIVHQSDIKTWARCPLMYRWQNIEMLPRLQSGSLTFGSIIHDCVLWMEVHQDLTGAISRFEQLWLSPTSLDPEYEIDYYVRGTNWKKYLGLGPDILRRWWNIISWESDVVLAREFEFDVPIGDGHVLHGTIDKLAIRYRADIDQFVVLISDYKTNTKTPTYGYIEEDLQFSAYAYASTFVEFWIQLALLLGLSEDEGRAMHAKYAEHLRYGEWVALVEGKRMDAGIREERHYNRLIMAVNALALSVAMRIFVPNISGESCRYCEFRKHCGLPELMEDEI